MMDCPHPELYARDGFKQMQRWGKCLLCERDALAARCADLEAAYSLLMKNFNVVSNDLDDAKDRLAEAERVLRKIVHDWDGEPDDIGDAQRWLTASARTMEVLDNSGVDVSELSHHAASTPASADGPLTAQERPDLEAVFASMKCEPWVTGSASVTREHTTTPDCWCNPTVDYVDPETGATVYVHNEPN